MIKRKIKQKNFLHSPLKKAGDVILTLSYQHQEKLFYWKRHKNYPKKKEGERERDSVILSDVRKRSCFYFLNTITAARGGERGVVLTFYIFPSKYKHYKRLKETAGIEKEIPKPVCEGLVMVVYDGNILRPAAEVCLSLKIFLKKQPDAFLLYFPKSNVAA